MIESFDQAFDTLDHLPVGVFVLDVSGNYLYVNKEYCETIQKPRSFFDDMSVPKLKRLGFLTTSVWEQVVERREPVVSCIKVTDEKMKRAYDTLAVGIPLFDEKGNIRSIICRQESTDKLAEYLQQGALNRHLFLSPSAQATLDNDDFIAQSPQMKQIANLLTAVSDTDVSILIVGPSGVGKEVLAKHVHKVSTRSSGPLITINCAAIPENLLESELFGYAKGAFTGASREGKQGMIEAADGGTLFLDEINSMPLPIQAKLLRVLETKQVTRLGALKGRNIDFRLVCASNEDLQKLVDQKLFRGDLFYRINVVSVSIPPLRERKEDIVPLALHFMDIFCKKYGRIKVLPERLLNEMQQYEWPGNVRELRNLIERSIVISNGPELEISTLAFGSEKHTDVPSPPQEIQEEPLSIPDDEDFSLKSYIDQCEKELFAKLLKAGKTAPEMAEILKISRSSVFRKLKKCQFQTQLLL